MKRPDIITFSTSTRELRRALEAAGFHEARTKGSHTIMAHPSGAQTVIPAPRYEGDGRQWRNIILQARRAIRRAGGSTP